METLARATIIGAGAIGTALGQQLTSAGKPLCYWDTDAHKSVSCTLTESVEASNVVFLAIPASAVATVLADLSLMTNHHPMAVIALCKGLVEGVPANEYLRSHLASTWDVGVLYGPMLASELSAGKRGFGVVSVSHDRWRGLVGDITTPQLRLLWHPEPTAVAWCAILKNCYALGLGLADGLDLGRNSRGAFVSQATYEMIRWLEDRSLAIEPAIWWSGLGDLIATGTSIDSFNYRTGHAIARQEQSVSQAHSEGAQSLRQLTLENPSPTPLLRHLTEIIGGRIAPASLGDFLASHP